MARIRSGETLARGESGFRAGPSTLKVKITLPATGRFAVTRALATHTSQPLAAAQATRHDWSKQEIQTIYDTPLLDLVFRAAAVHRQNHDANKIQLCTLMNIKSTYLSNMLHV